MELRTLMARAVEATVEVVLGAGPGTLDRHTPCPEFDVRALVGHMAAWTTERARDAALKRPLAPVAEVDVTAEPGWADRYAAGAREAGAAWSGPAAWEGRTSLSGRTARPATWVGGLVFAEFLVHAWDLAVATGQKLTLEEDLAEALCREVASRAEMAREYGAYGPEVPVAASAPPLDRALGLAGRDPAWSA
jgi:uncharacterized protein (TIGR03086 family)